MRPATMTGALALAYALGRVAPLPAQTPAVIRADSLTPGFVLMSGYANGTIVAAPSDDGVLLADAPRARRAPQADSALRAYTVDDLYSGMRSLTRGPAPVSAGSLIVTLGDDTLAVERFARYADRFEGTLVRRVPETRVHRYTVTLGPDGRPGSFVDSVSRRTGTFAPGELRVASVTFGPDSATITQLRDTAVVRRVPAARGFPALPESFALYELWLARPDSVIVLIAPAGG
ncbi:MAG TPA: hypothetical protein VFH97_02925, partial [Gemmatimonadales bacterium]|nr:hypothetical protein [Gemmatimonadales bacterium]